MHSYICLASAKLVWRYTALMPSPLLNNMSAATWVYREIDGDNQILRLRRKMLHCSSLSFPYGTTIMHVRFEVLMAVNMSMFCAVTLCGLWWIPTFRRSLFHRYVILLQVHTASQPGITASTTRSSMYEGTVKRYAWRDYVNLKSQWIQHRCFLP
jgi:hypothetical protein